MNYKELYIVIHNWFNFKRLLSLMSCYYFGSCVRILLLKRDNTYNIKGGEYYIEYN